ncbi:hypothetical protein FB451DRAFT_1419397 [Mycena latifolia]|nr:hypothetical protein FB451DRAFT_1419397 [Mycena latifolia]
MRHLLPAHSRYDTTRNPNLGDTRSLRIDASAARLAENDRIEVGAPRTRWPLATHGTRSTPAINPHGAHGFQLRLYARSARAGAFLPAARRAAICHSLPNDAHVDNAPGVDSSARGAGRPLLQLSVEGPYPPLAGLAADARTRRPCGGHAVSAYAASCMTPESGLYASAPFAPSRTQAHHARALSLLAPVLPPISVATLATTGSVKTGGGARPPSYAWGAPASPLRICHQGTARLPAYAMNNGPSTRVGTHPRPLILGSSGSHSCSMLALIALAVLPPRRVPAQDTVEWKRPSLRAYAPALDVDYVAARRTCMRRSTNIRHAALRAHSEYITSSALYARAGTSGWRYFPLSNQLERQLPYGRAASSAHAWIESLGYFRRHLRPHFLHAFGAALASVVGKTSSSHSRSSPA